MSNLLPAGLPVDDEGDSDAPDAGPNPPRRRRGSRPRSSAPHRLPTREELLARLDALGQMLLFDVIDERKANAMRGMIDSMLKALSPTERGATAAPLDMNRLREIVRANPQVADFLEPFLSDEQIAQLFEPEEDNADDRAGD